MHVFLALVLLLSSNLVQSRGLDSSNSYNGEWDLSAQAAAGLCYLVKNNLTHSGVEPPVLPKEAYLRKGSCWKYEWKPCEDSGKGRAIGPDKRRVPCGYYQMVDAPRPDCDV